MEKGKFPNGLCIIQVRYGCFFNGSPKISFFRYFDHSNRIPCVSMDPYSKNHFETGKFPYGFCFKMVSYWLHMVGVIMAHLKYLSLNIFLIYFDHSNRIPCVSMD